MNNRIDQLLNELAAVEEELAELRANEKLSWTRHITMGLHSCKESNWDKFESEELAGMPDEAGRTFAGTLYEVMFDLEVNKDGTSKILRVVCGKEVLVPRRPEFASE